MSDPKTNFAAGQAAYDRLGNFNEQLVAALDELFNKVPAPYVNEEPKFDRFIAVEYGHACMAAHHDADIYG